MFENFIAIVLSCSTRIPKPRKVFWIDPADRRSDQHPAANDRRRSCFSFTACACSPRNYPHSFLVENDVLSSLPTHSSASVLGKEPKALCIFKNIVRASVQTRERAMCGCGAGGRQKGSTQCFNRFGRNLNHHERRSRRCQRSRRPNRLRRRRRRQGRLLFKPQASEGLLRIFPISCFGHARKSVLNFWANITLCLIFSPSLLVCFSSRIRSVNK